MNLGLGTLTELKTQLLAPSLRSDTDFDLTVTAIGKGVAGLIEQWCQRKFQRVVDFKETLPADRAQFLLSRFPVESISKVELKLTEADGWQTQANDYVLAVDAEYGIVHLPPAADAGEFYSQIRFTYTGGYFFETLEPTDNGYPTAVPNGAATLPDDVKLAWYVQCQEMWAKKDKLGAQIADDPEKQTATAEMKLVKMAEMLLGTYRRINLI